MFSRTVPVNRNGSCSTMAICSPERVLRHVAHVVAADQHLRPPTRRRSGGPAPCELVLPEPVGPTSATVSPGFTRKLTSLQHRLARVVAEGHVAELDRAVHVRRRARPRPACPRRRPARRAPRRCAGRRPWRAASPCTAWSASGSGRRSAGRRTGRRPSRRRRAGGPSTIAPPTTITIAMAMPVSVSTIGTMTWASLRGASGAASRLARAFSS